MKGFFSSRSVVVALVVLILMLVLVSCRPAERVSYNLSKQADSFNIVRKLTVFNLRTNDITFQMVGNFSINIDTDGDLEIIGEKPDGTFYKHFVHLAPEISYVCEDLGSTKVSKHKYQLNFNPKMAIPIEIVTIE